MKGEGGKTFCSSQAEKGREGKEEMDRRKPFSLSLLSSQLYFFSSLLPGHET
jgi:hypothetical protein